jgi:glycosyltransferase involved in cell wall biosynthesis
MASARYRGYGWAERLQKRGVAVKVIYAQKTGFQSESFIVKIWFLLTLIVLSMQAKTIVFQKYVPPVWVQKLLAQKRMIFDFDDRIYETHLLQNPNSRIHLFLHCVDRIIVSVRSMRDELVNALPELSTRITIIPTLIDVEQYRSLPFKVSEDSKIRIGWIGSSQGLQYLSLVEESLFKLFVEFPDQIELIVVCNQPYTPTNCKFPVKNVVWSLAEELDYFAEIDVSMMPLDSSDRARSKAGFKAIQSLAAGVPVVASNVGFNQEIIQPGKNGFLAQTAAQFYDYLRYFVVDKSLREQMSQSARESATKYDYSAWEDLYFQQISADKV